MKIKSMWNLKQNKQTKQVCEYQHMKAAAIILTDVHNTSENYAKTMH